ncbi:UDP-N-acetylglucosamine 2-epimerase (plasmid) [Burkholderia sp. FERM BP-3421]|jgi:UDP-N-acetylglucosamine 2-epimerase (non-hydrolysing)|uniref:UDP-N-acetylglucosamine 2-epimerase n=1 Tax=Burkholderia sp. FERM BP-3421 TaxID=1494466 RepID=UPI002360FC7D|nr:UDP-N-acetylglucosamine 2-epimerase [Burkholderia sp. FERM BP-3421]WDD90465.1 UDP-N-acetylglucosamine 2-epimerase [Burkholderia sp. FERM BP-3421]
MPALTDALAYVDPVRIDAAVSAANERGRPLYLLVLATKPCYIKLASLVHACLAAEVPFLLVDSGQHYDLELTGAKRELGYAEHVAVLFGIRGTLLERAAHLARGIDALGEQLARRGSRTAIVPVVSGDTSTAALFPQYWYFANGVRSVHVEAGLRSLGPSWPGGWEALDDVRAQRTGAWTAFHDEPFPEGIDTRLASVASDLLLAPVERNVDQLVREGYPAGRIARVGSLSSDAVRLAHAAAGSASLFQRYPRLASGRWLRVDLHRRENMTPARLRAVLEGVARLSRAGVQVVLVKTNALLGALHQHALEGLLDDAARHGVMIHELWPGYVDVIAFLASPHCHAVYTDSGGLQEEAAVLGVPCITCRFSTDRPETVLDAETNLLVPPLSAAFVYAQLDLLLREDPEASWPGLSRGGEFYGQSVGAGIARLLADYQPATPLAGSRARFERR